MRLTNARPKQIRPGVWVPPGLQVNETTLRQHKDRLGSMRVAMTPALARHCGYPDEEIAEVFGAAALQVFAEVHDV